MPLNKSTINLIVRITPNNIEEKGISYIKKPYINGIINMYDENQ